jgi:hypothetical protein
VSFCGICLLYGCALHFYLFSAAALKEIGDDGAALFTMFLGIMTVLPILCPRYASGRRGRLIVLAMVAFVVVFMLTMVLIPGKVIPQYYGSTGCVVSRVPLSVSITNAHY